MIHHRGTETPNKYYRQNIQATVVIPLPSKLRGLCGSMVRPTCLWLAIAGCIVLFVALRSRGVGHLLMWDEAQDVCAARALADGSGDQFSARIWVHPPTLPALSLLVRPLSPGFPERYERLVLAINACVMVALFLLNRCIYGAATALWSCFFLAVMPGAVFYDVWIKGGAIVSLATIGAVAALMAEKHLLAGLCLGIALLDKETAGLPCLTLLALALTDPRHRNVKKIAGLVVVAACTAGWWYLCLATSLKYFVIFATASDVEGKSWTMPWHQYLSWLHGDMGTAGCVLLTLGVLALAVSRRVRGAVEPAAAYTWWPCALLLPAYVVVSSLPAKAPWILMFQYPALATLQAIGMVGVADVLGSCSSKIPRLRHVWLGIVAAAAAFMLVNATVHRHEREQRRVMPGALKRAVRTREIASAVNAFIAPDERVLATTFSFHGASMHNFASPIFAYYVTNGAPVMMVPFMTTFDTCAWFIVSYRLDWALLTPEPGAAAAAMTNGFKTRFGLDPVILDNGTTFLYRTTSAYRK